MVSTPQLWDYPGVFAITVQPAKDDIDAFGHVNNVVYLRWLTECAWAHSSAVGLPEEQCVNLRRGMAVRAIHVEFLAPAYEAEELLVGNWVSKKDRLRATRQYQIINPKTGRAAANFNDFSVLVISGCIQNKNAIRIGPIGTVGS